MSTDHFRLYDQIDHVVTFDVDASEPPSIGSMQVVAYLHELRVGIVVSGLGTVMLARDQLAELRAQLAQADRDVRGGIPHRVANGDEGRCESCSAPVRAGERVVIEEDAILHADRCPAEERGDG